MPRLQPPEGYTTAHKAAEMLGVSDALLSRYVTKGKLHKFGPENRIHKFYKISEVEKLLADERVYTGEYIPGSYKHNPSSRYELATEDDMSAIVAISRKLFGSDAMPAEPRLRWLRKNAETFFTLKNQGNAVVGYASLLPMSHRTIERLIHDDIAPGDISSDEIELYEPGKLMHIYIMSIGVDPAYPHEKREYGARILAGMFDFLNDLAQRGIEIATITARSHTKDGVRLLRSMGFPQLISPVPGKNLFRVDVSTSGAAAFMHYRNLLAQWRRNHPAQISKAISRPSESHNIASQKNTMPEGLIGYRAFSRLHGITESTTHKAIESKRLEVVPGDWIVGRAPVKGALDAAGREQFYRLYHDNPHFTACPECPHES